MRPRADLPSGLDSAPFSSSDASALGVKPWRLRGSDIEHPFHGVNVASSDDEDRNDHEVEWRCEAYLARMLPGQWFTHETAALLLGIPLEPGVRASRLHVGVRTPRTPPKANGVVGHRLSADVVVGSRRRVFPVCSPADVWCQLAETISRGDLVAAGDFLVGARRRAPLVTLDELRDASARYRGKRGAKNRAWVLERIRFGADSRPESLLRLQLVDHGLPEPHVNPPVPVDGGRVVLHPDLLLPDARIAFEYEGDGHRVERKQWLDDIERRDLYEEAGYSLIRVTSRDVFGKRDRFEHRLRRLSVLPRMVPPPRVPPPRVRPRKMRNMAHSRADNDISHLSRPS